MRVAPRVCCRFAPLILLLPVLDARAQTLLHRFDGNWTGGEFGYAVAGGFDADADGFDDVIVGSNDRAETFVFSGRTGRVLHGLPQVGRHVGSAGDADGDGFDDVLVIGRGLVALYSGRTGGVLHALRSTQYVDLGRIVGGLDLDGDGHDDFAFGQPTTAFGYGQVYLHSGRTGGLLATLQRGMRDDRFGYAVAKVGDVDHDGRDDFVVGAYGNDGNAPASGSAFVYSGRTHQVLWTFHGQNTWDVFGVDVAGAGDVDRDGTPDVLVGAQATDGNGTQSGSAHVFSGRTGARLHRFDGATALDYFGSTVSGAGDLDGDGHDDVLVGAYGHAREARGAVSAFSGRTGARLFFREGRHPMEHFGSALSAAGDSNGDGYADVLVGAYRADENYLDTGSAYLLTLGGTGTPPIAREVGTSCEGSSAWRQRLGVTARPFLGRSLALTLRGALPNTVALPVLGFPANVDLTPIGMTACRLWTTPDVWLLPTLTTPSGTGASQVLTVPNVSALLGGVLAGQWICFDARANVVGLTTSTGGLFRLGS